MSDTPASWRDALAALPWPAPLASGARRAAAAGVVVAGLAVAGAVGFVVVRGAPPAPEAILPMAGRPTSSSSPATGQAGSGSGAGDGDAAPAGEEAYVHVAGAVARPGLYRVRPGGRVADVLDAAGGPAGDADVDQLNLAAKVGDGERVYVPRRGETAPAPAGGGAAASGPLDLNAATLDQLDALPGVGPATAQAILDYRREHGRFTQVQELLEVRGIGEAKLADLRARVRV